MTELQAFKQNFGDKARRLIIINGLTLEEAAKYSASSKTTITKIKRGDYSIISADTIFEIYQTLTQNIKTND
jgi:transcriptional regulator with XRE-family HTH domain